MAEIPFDAFNPWWTRHFSSPGRSRSSYLGDIDASLATGKVAIVYGLRRVGKTTILRQYIARTLDRYGRDNILYLSADHPDVRSTSIIDIVHEFRRMKSLDPLEPHLVIFDEVHLRDGFEWEVKGLADIEDGLDIILSGSSSLVIRHRSAALTGRYRKVPVEPLRFDEFLDFTDRTRDTPPPLIESYFEEYLQIGGMPEYVLGGDPQDLIALVDDVIYKDITVEFGVNDPSIVKDLYFLLMDRVGRSLSAEKMGRLVGIGKDSVRRYIGYLSETFLLERVASYGPPNVRVRNPNKLYCPDNGIRAIAVGRASIGSQAENHAHRLLKGISPVRYYNGDGREIDFLLSDTAVEVKYKDTLEPRDTDPLLALSLRDIKRKVILTRSGTHAPSPILSLPLWRASLLGFEQAIERFGR